ncbi:hypothetical protein ACI2KS_10790 [Pseudomonas sp. NPDC087358]|uniref:hypothetical protein n=1 Tax=Pseudomonas sp. NPDC087358 TaxID=3364439 RepID=UPI00384EF815
MNITVYGQRHDDQQFEITKDGETLIINDERFDLSPLLEGASIVGSAVQSKWFSLGKIIRKKGVISLSLLYPVPANFSPEQATPKLLENIPDGPVELPKPLPDPAPVNESALQQEAPE